jgi:Tfp pilus assembly protein PilE
MQENTQAENRQTSQAKNITRDHEQYSTNNNRESSEKHTMSMNKQEKKRANIIDPKQQCRKSTMRITGKKNAQVEHKRDCPLGNNNNRKSLYKRLIEILHPNFEEIYTTK